MKRFILLCFVLLCFACKTEDEPIIGKCSDPIVPSPQKIDFSSEENSMQIKINHKFWWINGISLDKKHIELNDENMEGDREKFKIKNENFTIEKTNPTKIIVTMKENKTGKERTLWIGLQAGNCFSGLTVTQSSKK